MKRVLIQLIQLYQKTLSPDHGPFRHRYAAGFCKFRPTCSDYAKIALEKHPTPYALRLTLNRVLRCHPWQTGGFDPVP
ncbi:MAG TPA: membrane protein insertion efficiency factor YidD [Patescibacteria group bacterium]|nr:membrane protein insertion efficiency factor YidD [Patescibacteria group bacterium]